VSKISSDDTVTVMGNIGMEGEKVRGGGREGGSEEGRKRKKVRALGKEGRREG
jgi:hypothetical protein